jgi:hypothetical protein
VSGARGLVRLSMVQMPEVLHPDVEDPAEAKVKSAAAELVQTERHFLLNLCEVRDKFFPRLRTILTAPEAKCLFGNWAELVRCAENLKTALDDAGDAVAEVLVAELPKLREPYSKSVPPGFLPRVIPCAPSPVCFPGWHPSRTEPPASRTVGATTGPPRGPH